MYIGIKRNQKQTLEIADSLNAKVKKYCIISKKTRQKIKISMYRILTMRYFDVPCYIAGIKRVPTFMDG